MKKFFLLAASLLLAGPLFQMTNAAEPGTVEKFRWALADKHKIDTAIFSWTRAKMEETKKAESLPPEIEAKIRHYEMLNNQLMQKQFGLPPRIQHIPPPFPPSGEPAPKRERPAKPQSDQEYEALSKQVAEAKAPVADIVDRRDQQSAKLREQYQTEKLIAEYAKGRFDLVVDAGMSHYSSPILYHASGDVVDITDSVLDLFKEKTKL